MSNASANSIKQRRDGRLALLCKNISIDKIALDSLINPNDRRGNTSKNCDQDVDKVKRQEIKTIQENGDEIHTTSPEKSSMRTSVN